MPISAGILSRHFTNLIGRKVLFAQIPPADTGKGRQVFGVYTTYVKEDSLIYEHHTREEALVVQADLTLLASMAGALVGLPDAEVRRHLAATPLEELLRDAINELLNVAAAVIAEEGRTVLTDMVTDAGSVTGAAARTLSQPQYRLDFEVTVDGYQGGRFSVLS